MAVTKLLRMKETAGGNKASHLKHNIFYICDPRKTDGGLYIGGNAGVDPEMIYRMMMRNKEAWGKLNGSQGFHYMLSFPPDSSVDENTALKIGEEFCEELFGEEFYHVVAVHNDKEHMHVHITFDSVSKNDGHKFHSPKGDWGKRIQPITDRLCEKYQLPTLQYDPERRGVHYGEWKNQQEEKTNQEKSDQSKMDQKKTDWETAGGAQGYSWYDVIRDDIDEAIANTDSMEDFLQYLKDQKYTVRNGKSLSLRPYGKPQAVRTSRLGRGYTKDEIEKRIKDKELSPQMEKRYKTYGNRAEMQRIIFAKLSSSPGWKMSPFLRRFYQRWNNTVFIRKPGRVTPWKYKKDILEVEKLAQGIHYMMDFDIHCAEDLHKRRSNLTQERDAIERSLKSTYTRYYKNKTIGQVEREALQKDIVKYRGALRDIKKEIHLVDDIFRRFYEMETAVDERTDSRQKPIEVKGREYTKVTIHQKMFQRMTSEFYVTRIPFMKNTYVKIPAKDCVMYEGNEMFAAYIFHDEVYDLQNSSGKKTGAEQGSVLRNHYDDKTGRRRKLTR